MLSICDIVLNHTANETPWLSEHPEATYNCSNCPHLRPAALLDALLARLTADVARGDHEARGVPRRVTAHEHLEVRPPPPPPPPPSRRARHSRCPLSAGHQAPAADAAAAGGAAARDVHVQRGRAGAGVLLHGPQQVSMRRGARGRGGRAAFDWRVLQGAGAGRGGGGRGRAAPAARPAAPPPASHHRHGPRSAALQRLQVTTPKPIQIILLVFYVILKYFNCNSEQSAMTKRLGSKNAARR